jgi:transposase
LRARSTQHDPAPGQSGSKAYWGKLELEPAAAVTPYPHATAERQTTQRNIELMWLVGRLAPDFKTIADFRKDNGGAIRAVCRQFVEL